MPAPSEPMTTGDPDTGHDDEHEDLVVRGRREASEDRRIADLQVQPRNRETLIQRAEVTEVLVAEVERLRIVDAVRWERMQRVLAMNDDLRTELAEARTTLGAVAALAVRMRDNGQSLTTFYADQIDAALAPVSGAIHE